ncbi:TetR/AcrR family transcriptional regulator [Streptomyces sp. NPDC090052]|uniref:TetR/AcrR family transcriptional regulator n=1 Tax=unclassified Streptomyces TaxID=2593676 RepID=UPI00225548B6|nr:TetR/AcrR family transcriptional regulator [Streptomyces sp. NBC_01306]MCX4723169.1 TetR/AcrR family transcriptional regulator [Streptomyces sp. NBC_01306]WSV07207.1 TetR/AcrR family transcriptional regulator [Streptomyces sp. NBC_01020]WSX66655.1 TetR/AcrR family transcriptional regulator [Streptomyces sp. NBC_00932]
MKPAAPKPAEDRRVRRTRHALRSALVGLVLDHGFHAITVEELTERADVARATFYSHYRDKEDLLVDVVRELAADRERLLPAVEQAQAQGFTGLPVLYIFQHAEQEKPVYRVILRGEGDGRALREFTEIICDRVERLFRERAGELGVTPRIPFDVIARAWTGELIGMLTWWVENDTGYSAAEITGHLRDLSVYGRVWASGLTPSDAPGAVDSTP